MATALLLGEAPARAQSSSSRSPAAEAIEGSRLVYDPVFQGREPASAWIGGPRPESEALGGGSPMASESVASPGWFARLAGRPSLGSQVHRESWLRRPLNATWFLGGVVGSPMIDDWVRGDGGVFGGVRLGWDFDHYWGAEFRLAFGSVQLIDSQRAIDAQHWHDTLAGFSPNDPYYHRFDGTRNADLFLYDINLLYYPRGDDPIRPYLTIGIGGAQFSLIDRLGQSYEATLLTMPFGIGLKYHWTDWLALRFEVCDNVSFGAAGLSTMHNVSVVGAAEIRLGGSRRSYWPWTPGRATW